MARPSQCLFCSFSRALRASAPTRRFHTSPQLSKPKKQKSKPTIKPYTNDEMKALEQKYTPAQMAAVRAGEEAVNPKDFEKADLRKDPWSLRYLDDLSEIDAVIDKPIRAPYSNTDPRQRLKTEEEIDEGLTEYMNSIGTGLDFSEKGELQASEDPSNDISDVNRQQEEALMNILSSWPEKPSEEQMQRLEDANEKEEAGKEEFYDKVVDMPITVGKEEAERNPRSALAPELFAPGEETLQLKQKKQNKASSDEAEEEASPALQRLIQMTGLSRRQISMLRVKTVYDHQVTNQTRMGKINKTYVLSIAGNSQGLIGIGEGKSDEAGEARLQSQYRAIRNMQPILRYEDRTIFGDVKGKVGATELELFTRPPGFGLRCQQYVWEIARCAGISDLAARVGRSRNPMNTVKATVAALLKQKNPEDVARARGRKMVDVRKVYYAGAMA